MKRFSILLIGFLLVYNLYAQTDTAYIYTYGGIQNDICNQIKPTNDGGYIMIGTSNSFGCGNTDFYAVKIDSLGKHEWSRTYGGIENEEGFSVTQTYDHGYAFVGFTDSYGAGGYDVFLVKTDSVGNFQWQKTYGGSDWDFGYSIQQLKDSGFIICGLTYSYGPGNGNVYVVRTDKDGDTLWTRALGGTSYYSIANSVCVHEDSLYFMAGCNTKFGGQDTNVFIMELDNKGTLKWDTTYYCRHSNYANSIRGTSDNGFILFGATDSVQIKEPNEMMIKLDSTGKMQWMHIYYTFGDTSFSVGHDAIEALNGSYLAISTSNAFGLGGFAMRIWQFDATGSPLSGPSYGGINDEQGNSVAIGKNGGIAFAGSTDSPGNTVGLDDVYVVRLKTDTVFNFVNYYAFPYHQFKDTSDCTLGIPSHTIISPAVKVCPNPIYYSSIILVQGSIGEHYTISIYDVSGQSIIEGESLETTAHGQYVTHFNKRNLAAGAYIYEILNQSGIVVANGKIIVE